MASTWARDLTHVCVAKATEPKRFTVIIPFYLNRHFFAQQVAGWAQWSDELRAAVSVIVVDDGSPEPAVMPNPVPLSLRLFRIHEDRQWNWLAARNIGAHHAADGWMLLTDMDHVLPAETADAIIWGKHDPSVVYAFSRREHTGEPVTPHSASFLMTRALFWTIGGYDETLSGHYGTDGDFRRRIMKVAPIHVLPEKLVRYEYVSDSSTSRYPRKLPADATAVKQLVAQRAKGWTPKVLSFPYQEVTC